MGLPGRLRKDMSMLCHSMASAENCSRSILPALRRARHKRSMDTEEGDRLSLRKAAAL